MNNGFLIVYFIDIIQTIYQYGYTAKYICELTDCFHIASTLISCLFAQFLHAIICKYYIWQRRVSIIFTQTNFW